MTVVTSNVDGGSFPAVIKGSTSLRRRVAVSYVPLCTAVIEYLIDYLAPSSMGQTVEKPQGLSGKTSP